MAGKSEDIIVDNLVLDIQVKDSTKGETAEKKIANLNKVLNRFQKIVTGLDIKVFKTKFSSMATAIKPLVNQLKKAEKGLSALSKVLKSSSLGKAISTASKQTEVEQKQIAVEGNKEGTLPSEVSGKARQLGGINQKTNAEIEAERNEYHAKTVKELSETYGELMKTVVGADGTQIRYYRNLKGNDQIISKVSTNIDNQGRIIKDSVKEISKTIEDISGDSLKSFILSVRRIGLYRAIRTILKFVTQSIESSIENLSAFDMKTKSTLNQLNSSIDVIKNSIGLVIMPLLELATPLIQVLATVVGTFANAISRLVASLKGQSTWTKINTEYLKEYNKQSSLLSFDEFSSLSNNNGMAGLYEDTTEGLGNASSIIRDIAVLLGAIAAIPLVKWVISGGLKGIASIFDIIKSKMSGASKVLNGIWGIVGGIALAFQSIYDIVNWDETTTSLQKVFNILTLIAGVVAVIAGVLAAFLPGGGAKIAKAVMFGALLVGGISSVVAMTQHADGGMFEGTGTIYHQVGEAGAEIVATGSRGTGVVNIIQFKEAMVQALSEYNVARHTSAGGDIVLQIDGKELARSQVSNNASALMQRYNIVLVPR